MARSKLFISLLVIVGICTLAATSFAKKKDPCKFNGDYSFFFWDPGDFIAGVGYFSVSLDPTTKCRSGIVVPGGIIDCNFETGEQYQDYIEGGAVYLEADGEGTMLLETNSSSGICGTGTEAIELDISLVKQGRSVLFNSDGEQNASSGLIAQAGNDYALTGRADKCFNGQISGCYNARFWTPWDDVVADCTICTNGAGGITGGGCSCNVGDVEGDLEYTSPIVTGGYTLGEDCQSSTGYMWITTDSEPICGAEYSAAFDFVVANGGLELLGACDSSEYIVGSTTLYNAGYYDPCAFEAFQQ